MAMHAVNDTAYLAKKEKSHAAVALAKFQTGVDAASTKGCDSGEGSSPAGEAFYG